MGERAVTRVEEKGAVVATAGERENVEERWGQVYISHVARVDGKGGQTKQNWQVEESTIRVSMTEIGFKSVGKVERACGEWSVKRALINSTFACQFLVTEHWSHSPAFLFILFCQRRRSR